MPPPPEPQVAPLCVHCVHYFVTYDPATPHACRYFGMKSRMIPSMVVKNESGKHCGAFEVKNPPKGKRRG
ncbi:MAG: hypothetical protein ACI8Q9_000647 [Planctomycetota bacterium]|jgi:hypothetical protein